MRAGDVNAGGTLAPRLRVHLFARTQGERRRAEIHLLKTTLRYGVESIADAFLTGISLNGTERSLTLEFPLDREVIQHVADTASGDSVELSLDFSGWARVHRVPTEGDPAPFLEEPTPGEWGFITLGEGQQAALPVRVPRSDWYTRVMEPVGTLSYLVTEIPFPKGDAGHAFLKPLNHLRAAERSFAIGDDPSVFLHCRAAVEALPGYPTRILEPLANRNEATKLDALLKKAGAYLHVGRHPADDGDRQGEFPVDHGDAGFALSLTRLLLSHVARRLTHGAS